jgi:hypothetical protein
MIDQERAVCGILTCFGVLGRGNWSPDQFQTWLDGDWGLDLRIDHGPLLSPRGCIQTVGTLRQFAVVNWPTPGLLALGEIDHADGWGDSLLHDLRLTIQQLWLPGWCMSITVLTSPDTTDVWPVEASLTRNPAHPDAKVLAVGERAAKTFEFLSGERDGETPGQVFGRADS